MKHHIFIGSTLDDLKSERKELPRIVMELGHIPVMADFLDDSVKNAPKLLQKIIEESDYCIALVAHKYCDKDGKASPLMKECSIAEKKGIPVLALVIDEKARWKPVKKEKNPALISDLNEFKAKLRGGPHEDWHNTPDLCQKAAVLLAREMNIDPRPGWVRSNRVIEPSVANELSRLSCENSALRRQYCNQDREMDAKLLDSQNHTLQVLDTNRVSLSFYYDSGDNWENTRQFRHIRIFKILVPELAIGKSTSEISRFLGTVLNPDLGKAVRKDYPTPSNSIKKIMADFAVLNLVKCVNTDEVKASDEIWEITEYGKDIYSIYRMRQFEKALAKKAE